MATGLFPQRSAKSISSRSSAEKAASSRPGRLLRDLASVGSGAVVCQVLATVTSLALRALMEPALVGVWSGLKVFLSYGNLVGLGANKAAAREIAFETARRNRAAADKARDAAFTVNTVTSVLYALALFAAAAWMRATATGPLASYWAAGLATIGVLVLLSRYSTFLITTLRARQEFGRTTRLALFEAVLSLGFTVVGVWLWGLYGLFVGTAMVMLAGIGFLQAGGGLQAQFRWDFSDAKRLVRIGAPILAGGLVLTFLRTVDKLMILIYLPDAEHELGCYSLGLMAAGGLTSLANVIGIVVYPRYQTRYGETGKAIEVARFALRITEASAFVLSLVFLAAALAVPPLLGWLLPAYRDGLAALVVLLPGVLLLCLAQPVSHYLISVGKQSQTVAVVLAAVLVSVLANHLVLSTGQGITGVAVASTGSYAFYALAMGVVAYGPLFSFQQSLSFLFRCSAPVVLAMGTFGVARYAMDSHSSLRIHVATTIGGGMLLGVGWAMLWRKSRAWRKWLGAQ